MDNLERGEETLAGLEIVKAEGMEEEGKGKVDKGREKPRVRKGKGGERGCSRGRFNQGRRSLYLTGIG